MAATALGLAATLSAHLGLLFNDGRNFVGLTTTHLAAHLLEELTRLLAGHELELVTTTASDGGRVTGRTVEGDKSFRGSRSRHSVLYTLEEKFLDYEGVNAVKKVFMKFLLYAEHDLHSGSTVNFWALATAFVRR